MSKAADEEPVDALRHARAQALESMYARVDSWLTFAAARHLPSTLTSLLRMVTSSSDSTLLQTCLHVCACMAVCPSLFHVRSIPHTTGEQRRAGWRSSGGRRAAHNFELPDLPDISLTDETTPAMHTSDASPVEREDGGDVAGGGFILEEAVHGDNVSHVGAPRAERAAADACAPVPACVDDDAGLRSFADWTEIMSEPVGSGTARRRRRAAIFAKSVAGLPSPVANASAPTADKSARDIWTYTALGVSLDALPGMPTPLLRRLRAAYGQPEVAHVVTGVPVCTTHENPRALAEDELTLRVGSGPASGAVGRLDTAGTVLSPTACMQSGSTPASHHVSYDNIEVYLRAQPWYIDQLVAVDETPASDAVLLPFSDRLPPPLCATLAARGITSLFSHQAAAMDALAGGAHVVVSTSTSSGKSLIYTLPMLRNMLADASACTLLCFPTKALAQDQLRALRSLVASNPLLAAVCRPAVLDGDASWEERGCAARDANVLLTNPDALHAALLPYHARWQRFISHLALVAIDEAHTLRGTFGAHASAVLRRLVRVMAYYGARPPLFVCTTATIANPVQHVRALLPIPPDAALTCIDRSGDGSGRGRRKCMVWRPPTLPACRAAVDAATDALLAASGRTRAEVHATPRKPAARAVSTSTASAEPGARHVSGRMRGRVAAAAAAKPQPQADALFASEADVSAALEDDSARFIVPQPSDDLEDAPTRLRVSTCAQTAASVQQVTPIAHAHEVGVKRPRSLCKDDAGAAPTDGATPACDAAAAAAAAAATRPEAVDKAVAVPRHIVPPMLPGVSMRGTEEEPRRASLIEAALLLAACVTAGFRCLMFARSRRATEAALGYVHEALSRTADGRAHIPRVVSYQAGYTPAMRRDLERRFFGGELAGMVATNALELGVDVGALDVVILCGYPGTTAALHQQAGRVGRGGRDALVFYVPKATPLDTCFVEEARRGVSLFQRLPEPAMVDLSNPIIMRAHVLCAAAEVPLTIADAALFGAEAFLPVFTALRTAGALIPVPGSDAAATTGVPTAPAGSPTPRVHAFTAAGWIERPSARVSLRDMDDVKYRVINDASGEVLAEVEEARAMWEIHEGAIFQHQGAVYKVLSFNLHTKEAHVRATKEAYFTTTIDVTDINVLTRTPAPPQQSLPLSAGGDIANTACVLPAATSFGRVLTTMQVFGYRKVWRRTYQTFEECRLALPPLERQTCGVWADLPLSLRTALMREGHDLYAACHAAAHAVKAVFPLFVHCDVSDVATECQNELATRARPFRVMLIDRTSGGLGITTAAARCIVPLFRAALHMLEGCACTTGCAACVLDVRCSQGNSLIDKDGARRLISGLLSPLPPT